ncbi:hypothetical protein [Paracoccus aminovorans]|nr:hypothetical protein [Paracoccus aminovorans]CQR84398.1 hypothetical protein JCM7685_pAMV3p0453 [Paracoccus aminovorans]
MSVVSQTAGTGAAARIGHHPARTIAAQFGRHLSQGLVGKDQPAP